MRTIGDVRNRHLEMLRGALARPAMYGGNDSGVQLIFLNLLSDLAYIDEKEAVLDRAYRRLDCRGMWRATRLVGAFATQFSRVDSFMNEISSVFAEIAHELGYVTLDRVHSESEWRGIRETPRRVWRERDWHISGVTQRIGDPSFVIGGSWHQVHCYASDLVNDWIFFDYVNEWSDTEPRGLKYGSDSILRNVRLPTPQFSRGIVFTPFGRQFK